MAGPYRFVCYSQPTYSCVDDQFFDPWEMCSTSDDFYSPDLCCTMMLPPQCIEPQQPICEVVRYCDEFCVKVDVQHFKPEEIEVKTVDNRVIIHAKHDERKDEHGFICREFTRQYDLPEDVDPQTVTSCISSDGVLIIKAPRMAADAPRERIVPIEYPRGTRRTNGISRANGTNNIITNGTNITKETSTSNGTSITNGTSPVVSTSKQRN